MFRNHCCYSEHNCCGGYKALVWIGRFLASFLLLVIRVFFGAMFFLGGLAKLGDARAVADFFANIHIPMPLVMAYVVGIVETVAGALLVIGFASRFAALLLIITMIGAFATAHTAYFTNFWADPSAFMVEKAFSFLLAGLVILCFGPGIFSLDYLIERFICKQCCSKDHPHN